MNNCLICGVEDPEEHRNLERSGIVNHQYSRDGSLTKVEKAKPETARRRNEVLVVPGVDLPLRTLLIEKGILSADDFENAGSIPGFARSDRAGGPGPGAEGSMRTAPEPSAE